MTNRSWNPTDRRSTPNLLRRLRRSATLVASTLAAVSPISAPAPVIAGAAFVAAVPLAAVAAASDALAAGQLTVYGNSLPDGTPVPSGPWAGTINQGNVNGGPIGFLVEGVGNGWNANMGMPDPVGMTFASSTINANRQHDTSSDTAQATIYSSWLNFGWNFDPDSGYGGKITFGSDSGTWSIANPSTLAISGVCSGTRGSCYGTWTRLVINRNTMVLNDPNPPTGALKNGGGELLDASWHTDPNVQFAITASDAESGVYRSYIKDGSTYHYASVDPANTRCQDRVSNGNAYEFAASATSLVPCRTASQDYSPTFDLSALGDGSHTGLELGVEDASGRTYPIASNRTVKINLAGGSLPDADDLGPGGCVYQVDGTTCTLPPSNTAAPTLNISGAPVRNTAITIDPGTWSNASGSTFTYQWQRCTTTNVATCADITGATGSTYPPTLADVGKRLRVIVTATTPSVGSADSASPISAEVADSTPAGSAPESGGGNAPPTGGGGGGGSTKTVTYAPTGAPTGGDVGTSAVPTKDRGVVNGDCSCDAAMLENADIKAVFSTTKTSSLSTTFGKGTITITGRLTTKAGDPIRNAWIHVTAKLANGAQYDDHGIHTDADGKYTITLPRNVLAQTVRVAYLSHMKDNDAADTESLTLRMKATASLSITTTVKFKKGNAKAAARQRNAFVVRDGSVLTFRVVVYGPIPVGGKTVQIQSTCTGSTVCKKTWGDIGPVGKTNSKGVYAWRVKAAGNKGKIRYRFRAVVPKVDGASNDWPFETGFSPIKSLTIKGAKR